MIPVDNSAIVLIVNLAAVPVVDSASGSVGEIVLGAVPVVDPAADPVVKAVTSYDHD